MSFELKLPPIKLSFFADPKFILGMLHGAQVAVEKASPDYTVAHHIASLFAKALGEPDISTPTASAAEPVLQALGEGAQAAAADVEQAVEAAQK